MIDGSSHDVLWQLAGLNDLESIAIADLDGAGKAEIVVGDGQWGDITGYDGTGAQLWQIVNPQHTANAVAAGDVNSDGAIEIVWGTERGGLGGHHFVGSWTTQTVLWSSEDLDMPLRAAACDLDRDFVCGAGDAAELVVSLADPTHVPPGDPDVNGDGVVNAQDLADLVAMVFSTTRSPEFSALN